MSLRDWHSRAAAWLAPSFSGPAFSQPLHITWYSCWCIALWFSGSPTWLGLVPSTSTQCLAHKQFPCILSQWKVCNSPPKLIQDNSWTLSKMELRERWNPWKSFWLQSRGVWAGKAWATAKCSCFYLLGPACEPWKGQGTKGAGLGAWLDVSFHMSATLVLSWDFPNQKPLGSHIKQFKVKIIKQATPS